MQTNDRYLRVGNIGRGSMGAIELAIDARAPDRLVALKTALRHDLEDVDGYMGEALAREARVMAHLDHPNIARTLGYEAIDGAPRLVLEYLEGLTLSELFVAARREGRRLPARLVLRVVKDVLAGLSHAHGVHGLVHRDLSPGNLLVTLEGTTKILDFGIAKSSREPTIGPPNAAKGKLRYMAPEQMVGAEDVDGRADLFAVGVILWEGLTGVPFAGPGVDLVAVRLADCAPRVSSVVPEVNASLDAIVARCLARDPDARFRSAAELSFALDEVITFAGERMDRRALADLVWSGGHSRFEARRSAVTERRRESAPPREPSPTVRPVVLGVAAGDAEEPTAIERPSGRRSRWAGLLMVAAAIATIGTAAVSGGLIGRPVRDATLGAPAPALAAGAQPPPVEVDPPKRDAGAEAGLR